MLAELAERLRLSLGIEQKKDIQAIAHKLKLISPIGEQDSVLLGDDCAAISDGDGYLLLAAEGIWPKLLQEDPWFAGWCSVLVNVSDIYAMGGRPIAVVDTVWSQSQETADRLWEGMIAASQALNVPIVGGHTNCHSEYEALSVAILGRSRHLISSFQAQPGDVLLLVTDFNGNPHPRFPNCWDAATAASPHSLQRKLAFLPQMAAVGFCDAGKDISMGGIVGTTLMLLESSCCGAVLELDQVPCPVGLNLEQWLLSFPSYGFLLSVRPAHVSNIQVLGRLLEIICEPIGQIIGDRELILTQGHDLVRFWDLEAQALTGFSGEPRVR